MADNPLPEMLRLSLSDLALRIKILKVKIGNSIEDVLSRALDPPSQINVQRAVQALVEVRSHLAFHETIRIHYYAGKGSYSQSRHHGHGTVVK